MGKKHKHSKDKLYNTVSELKSHHVTNRELEFSALHRRLKFDSCCLTLNTITKKPVGLCDTDGYCYVFECEAIVKFLEKFQKHPITGLKVSGKDLINLKFYKNKEDQYHCPVIYKLFNQHSKIVANRKNGNVYSFEAYQQLNLKPNSFRDLLTNELFEKGDIVTIQDPDKADLKWNVSEFYHVKNKLKIDDNEEESKIRPDQSSDILKSSLEEYKSKADSIVETFNKIVGQGVNKDGDKKVNLDKINSATYSDGALSSSVTSTVAPVKSSQNAAILKYDEILYPRVKKKGYAQIVTNLGPLNLELYCDKVPKTCHNFLRLASKGYYDGTCFHRLVKNFILQGGDPTGTGKGGQSAWMDPFKDEIFAELKHDSRGVLAMANSGPNTNKSQFYITLKRALDHLDGKHTVFGRVVGGEDTLDKIEMVEVDKNDRPKREIKILQILKYVDPFEEAEALIREERRNEAMKRKAGSSTPMDKAGQSIKKFRSGIGAYINLDRLKKGGESSSKPLANVERERSSDDEDQDEQSQARRMMNNPKSLSSQLAAASQAKKVVKAYGDFSNW